VLKEVMSRGYLNAGVGLSKFLKLSPVEAFTLASSVNPFKENTCRLMNKTVHSV
jgi:hypothetical protein